MMSMQKCKERNYLIVFDKENLCVLCVSTVKTVLVLLKNK
jgi:hypothetical protein